MNKKIGLLLVISAIVILFTTISGCLSKESPQSNATEDIVVIEDKGTYQSIQEAINDALDGDTILVGEGIYNESLLINKSVTLMGKNKDTTIIDGSKTGDVIFISADFVNISGFTIRNGSSKGFRHDEKTVIMDAGIDIHSNFNIISDNNISLNGCFGICIYAGSNNILSNNIISENEYGIYLENAYENNISSNTILSQSTYGIYLGSSNENTISDNIISDNEFGSRIKGSEENMVLRNVFENNEMGLYFCCGAKNNVVFSNSFINNSQWNAESGDVNQWDNGMHGNYWDDYYGIDVDDDGIGETPYAISSGENTDNFPLMQLPDS